MLQEERGITVNECGFDPDLIELNDEEPIVITAADESDGYVTVEFEQSYDGDGGFDNLDAWTWKYTTVQETELVQRYLEIISGEIAVSTCQCLYEIHNKLPRTKFCMMPCAEQREARKILRK